jgi:phosphonopyruvate decarboxylase
MIQPKDFFEAMSARGVDFYAGVPDSLLANFCAYLDDHAGRNQHLITANEGNAVALAMGYHMATGKVAMIYMQNSGLGNTINPLTSLADTEVYKVPMLLVIGWRGEPGVKDEPQHVKQGQITLKQLDILGIPHWTIDASSQVDVVLDAAFTAIKERNSPVALVVRKDTFAKYKPQNKQTETATLARESALETLLAMCDPEDLIVSTTGKTSREVFELRAKHQQSQRDFLTVGGMGHTSSIALGVAIGLPGRRVVCLDGDGSLLMHMGAMPVIANYRPHKFIHVLLNNYSHESVGGQATSARLVNFEELAKAVSYAGYAVAHDTTTLVDAWKKLSQMDGPLLLEVKVRNGSRDDLGRPTSTAEQNKLAFMESAGVR